MTKVIGGSVMTAEEAWAKAEELLVLVDEMRRLEWWQDMHYYANEADRFMTYAMKMENAIHYTVSYWN